MPRIAAILPILACFGCAQKQDVADAPPIITSTRQLDDHIGLLVTIRGEVMNTKIATILGVDVESDAPDLRGQVAEATGYLQLEVVTQKELDELQRDGPVANRGTGTFYRLQSVDSDYDAQVRLLSP